MWWNRLLLLPVMEISKTCNFKTIPLKDMINLWWIVQIVLELLVCLFVHGQLWRNIVEKKLIRRKTERIWGMSIFPSFQAFDYGANVRSFLTCWKPRNGSSWVSCSVFFTFSLFLFGSFREVSKMWKEDLGQVYARMLHNYNQKLPICLSVFQNEKKILAMQNVHFQFWQVLHECCLLHPKK